MLSLTRGSLSCWPLGWGFGNDGRLGWTVQQPRLLDIFVTQSSSVSQSCEAVLPCDSCSPVHAECPRIVMHNTVIVIWYTKTVDSAV